MNRMIAIRKVKLNERDLCPARTKHTLVDGKGTREFPPFVSLAICQYPGDPGYYLMHICEGGECADTWHENLEDAIHQAEFEFGVQPEEWAETSETF